MHSLWDMWNKHPIISVALILVSISFVANAVHKNAPVPITETSTQEVIEPRPETEPEEEFAGVEASVPTDESVQESVQKQQADTSPVTPTGESVIETHAVVRVVDGDTVQLSMDGTVETIRIIGMDSPESVHPTEPVACFGLEASQYAKQLLDGKAVQLERDPSQGTRDKYGRLLGYVILPDGRNFSQVMIEEGYAYEYTYNIPYAYQAQFKAAQESAKMNERGLWAPDACMLVEDVQEPVSTQAPLVKSETNTTVGAWYTSSYHSAKYYYHESCDGWQGLSPRYLTVYTSEDALKFEHPAHVLHPDCRP